MRNPLINKIKQLAQQEQNLDVLWLYGSRAKGNASQASDYDLAVAFKSFPEDKWQQRILPESLAIDWAEKLGVDANLVSVVDINHIPIQLAMSVIEHGEALIVKDSLRLAREENRITSMWEVDHQYHREHYG